MRLSGTSLGILAIPRWISPVSGSHRRNSLPARSCHCDHMWPRDKADDSVYLRKKFPIIREGPKIKTRRVTQIKISTSFHRTVSYICWRNSKYNRRLLEDVNLANSLNRLFETHTDFDSTLKRFVVYNLCSPTRHRSMWKMMININVP